MINTMPKTITLVNLEDWQGIYVDGVLWGQDHNVESEVFSDLLEGQGVVIEYEHPTSYHEAAEYYVKYSMLPIFLEELEAFKPERSITYGWYEADE